MIKSIMESGNNMKTYAYRSKKSSRSACSSGGIFADIANAVLDKNGVVVGAAFNENFEVYHKIVTSKDELNTVIGSKYAQSAIGDIYKQTKVFLKEGRLVLFSGLTCQIEGLLCFLQDTYDNLFCIDLICMGIPSPGVWREYLKTYFNEYKIKSINFKHKIYGWHKFAMYIESFNKSPFIEVGMDNPFMQLMFKGYTIRPACFECFFKSEIRHSDITIADCWGCENYASELDDNLGLSMVIIHSDKGDELFELVKKDAITKEFKYDNVLKYNPNYYRCAIPAKKRTDFFTKFWDAPHYSFMKYGRNPNKNALNKLKVKIKHFLRKDY